MTKEQFEEAIKVNDRIKLLKRVLNEFKKDNSCRLSLIYGGTYCSNSKYNEKFFVWDEITNIVKDKLKIYTERFIEELNKEIEELNKKIEKL